MSRFSTLRKIFLASFIALLFVIANSGCSVFMAARQPSKKDVDLFKVETPRSSLLAEFGEPIVGQVRDGKNLKNTGTLTDIVLERKLEGLFCMQRVMSFPGAFGK